MKKDSTSPSRKKFLLWGALAVCSATLYKIIPGMKAKEKPTTVRLLAEDGTLVEIDQELLTPGKKITNLELQKWIKK
jgi:hypothetical protein